MTISSRTYKHFFCNTLIVIFILPTIIYAEANLPKQHVCLRISSVDENYLDTTYNYLNSWFCEPANWFDEFFADDRDYNEAHAKTKIRWRNDVFFSENAKPEYITTVAASLRLPKISKRLKLVFDSDEQENIEGVIPTTIDNAQGSFGFLYDFIDSQKANLSLRLRLTPSLTLRYRYTHPFSDTLILRLTQNIYREEGEFGENTRLDFDKTLNKSYALRWSSQVDVIEGDSGFDWVTALVLFHKLNEKSALSYESSINGETKPYNLATNYRLGIRYRRNFYRSWLFYELAPEVTWSKLLITDERHSIYAFTLRLEIFFEQYK